MVVGQTAMQSVIELFRRGLDASIRHRREGVRVPDPFDYRLDHLAARDAHDVADDRVELDVSFFEGFLDSLGVTGLLADELLARPLQRAQLLDIFVWDEARLDQAKGQKIGDPGGVIDVGLAARNVLDVRRIGQDEIEVPIAEDAPHRLPIDPRRLHGDVGAPGPRQPGQQVLKTRRRGLKRPTLPLHLAARRHPNRGHDHRLMNIKTGDALEHNVHVDPPFCQRRRRGGLAK